MSSVLLRASNGFSVLTLKPNLLNLANDLLVHPHLVTTLQMTHYYLIIPAFFLFFKTANSCHSGVFAHDVPST